MIITDEITEVIIGTAFEVMNELGPGFLETIYHRAFIIALQEKGLEVQSEVLMPVNFRGVNVGNFKADLIINGEVIVEIKAVEKITAIHKAQTANYLATFELLKGLIINFGNPKVEIARIEHPKLIKECL